LLQQCALKAARLQPDRHQVLLQRPQRGSPAWPLRPLRRRRRIGQPPLRQRCRPLPLSSLARHRCRSPLGLRHPWNALPRQATRRLPHWRRQRRVLAKQSMMLRAPSRCAVQPQHRRRRSLHSARRVACGHQLQPAASGAPAGVSWSARDAQARADSSQRAAHATELEPSGAAGSRAGCAVGRAAWTGASAMVAAVPRGASALPAKGLASRCAQTAQRSRRSSGCRLRAPASRGLLPRA